MGIMFVFVSLALLLPSPRIVNTLDEEEGTIARIQLLPVSHTNKIALCCPEAKLYHSGAKSRGELKRASAYVTPVAPLSAAPVAPTAENLIVENEGCVIGAPAKVVTSVVVVPPFCSVIARIQLFPISAT